MEIHAFECDSCHAEVPAHFNGCHYLPPKGWHELVNCDTTKKVGHLCDICTKVVFATNLIETGFGKKIQKDLVKNLTSKK